MVKLILIFFILVQSSIASAMTQRDQEEIKYWKSEFRKNQNDNVALYSLASAYYYAGKYKEAADYYALLSERDTDLRFEALYYLAITLLEIERYNKAYSIFQRLERKRIPQELKVKVEEYLALFEDPESSDLDESQKFLESFSFNFEGSYGSNSNPSYATETTAQKSSAIVTNILFNVKAFKKKNLIIDTYLNHYQEKYADLSTASLVTKDIGVNLFYYLKRGYLQFNPYLSSDSDKDSDTYTRGGGHLTYALDQEDLFTFTLYDTSTDESDLTYLAGTTFELSYTKIFTERLDEFRFTTIKAFKNNLNDSDGYYNSNKGLDLSAGVTRYLSKGNITGSLKYTYREYVKDETLGYRRYDNTWALSGRYSYPLNLYFSAIVNLSYIKNRSNWEGIEDYDPTFSTKHFSVGLTGQL